MRSRVVINWSPIREGDQSFYLQEAHLMQYQYVEATVFGRPAIDYLAFTTYDEGLFSALAFLIPNGDNSEEATMAGGRYKGYRTRQLYVGVREEKDGRMHYMIEGKGLGGEWLAKAIREEVIEGDIFNVTRLDIQNTIPETEGFDYRDMKDRIMDGKWRKRGRRPYVGLQEGDENEKGTGSTVYVGSQDSSVGFARIYGKRGTDGKRWTRFEHVFKGKRAKDVLMKLEFGNEHEPLNAILAGYPPFIEDMFKSTDGIFELKPSTTLTSHEKRYLWVKNLVIPSSFRKSESKLQLKMYRDLYINAARYFNERLGTVTDIESRVAYGANVTIDEVVATLESPVTWDDTAEGAQDAPHRQMSFGDVVVKWYQME